MITTRYLGCEFADNQIKEFASVKPTAKHELNDRNSTGSPLLSQENLEERKRTNKQKTQRAGDF
jgi:hypothetical protein